MANTQDPKWEQERQKKEAAGWERKGYKKPNAARGLSMGGKGGGRPVGGKKELSAMSHNLTSETRPEDLEKAEEPTIQGLPPEIFESPEDQEEIEEEKQEEE